MGEVSIPLTVVGGYLGAGKTTLVNHLLRHPQGRRIGVIVNDFGSIGLDADLLAGSTVDGGVISLVNGCACCTVGAGLHEALGALTARDEPPDQVVIEVSGVADPAIAAGWATVPPFEPAGVIVLVAGDSVRRLSRDRYVGAEVRRQLAGADLLVVTKADLCSADELTSLDAWLAEVGGKAPSIRAERGDVPSDVILGMRGTSAPALPSTVDHAARYEHRTWTADAVVTERRMRDFLDRCPAGVLRVKGVVRTPERGALSVQVVGRRVEIRPWDPVPEQSSLVAIGLRGSLEGMGEPF